MQIEWLNRQNNKNIIIFFNGWGSIIPSNLSFDNFDVLMVHNYQTIEQNFDIDIQNYEKKYLIAWSLGVYVSNIYYDIFKNFDGLIAINGTQAPIDDNFGIPTVAYNLTVDNFNELTCNKFLKKIGTDYKIAHNIKELKQELITIEALKPTKFLEFTKVILSTKDKIFPYKNMINFWNNKNTRIESIDSVHYIFEHFTRWSDLL